MVEFIVKLIIELLKVLFPAAAEDTIETSKPNEAVKARLQDAIRRRKTKTVKRVIVILLLCACAGCGTQTVLVPEGEPVMIRETIKGAKVYIWDKDGVLQPSVCDIPAGWYALADPGEDKPVVATK